MKIAFIAQPVDAMRPPVRGGSLSLWIYYMAKACAQRGHEAVVFGNHGGRFTAEQTRSENVDYVFTPTLLDKVVNKVGRTLLNGGLPEFAAAWHHRTYAIEAARHARRMNCDVVHIMNYSQFVPLVRREHPKARIALHMQCEWLTQLEPEAMDARLAQTDLMIGCSEYITRLVAEKFPHHAERCVTVPNATDLVPERTTPVSGQRVLFVGRLSPEKGLHDLIRAFHLVRKRCPEATLHLVGGAGSAPMELLVGLSSDPRVMALKQFYPPGPNGAKDPYLEILEQEAGPEKDKSIFFVGRVNHDQIEKHYADAAVLVNPSLSESFGISLVEAMVRKIPVVATKIGGMSYTVESGKTGLLVEAAEPQSLANALCEILENPEQARAMGEAGYKKAIETYSWERTADRLVQFLTRNG